MLIEAVFDPPPESWEQDFHWRFDTSKGKDCLDLVRLLAEIAEHGPDPEYNPPREWVIVSPVAAGELTAALENDAHFIANIKAKK